MLLAKQFISTNYSQHNYSSLSISSDVTAVCRYKLSDDTAVANDATDVRIAVASNITDVTVATNISDNNYNNK